MSENIQKNAENIKQKTLNNRKLTQKQQKFAIEYLIDLNATQAAIRAGYSKRTAYSIGNENLKKPEIQKYVDAELEKIENNKIADTKEIMEYLTSVLRGETESEVVVVEGIGDGCSEAKKIKKAPDEKEKTKAAELLGKRYGMFSENFKTNGNVVVNIVNDLEKDDEDEPNTDNN